MVAQPVQQADIEQLNITEYAQYLVLSGSLSYGTNHPLSDIDIRGFYIPPIDVLFSYRERATSFQQSFAFELFPWGEILIDQLNNRECDTTKPIDLVIYSFSHFFKLLSSANPNCLELLFVAPEDVLVSSAVGTLLRANRDLFVSAQLTQAYIGHAKQHLAIAARKNRWVKTPPVNPRGMLVPDVEYAKALKDWTAYYTWKNAGGTRVDSVYKYGFDVKDIGQLYRVLLQAREVLTRGTITVKNTSINTLLKSIHAGKLTYEAMVHSSERMISEINEIYNKKQYVIPEKVNQSALDGFYKLLLKASYKI